MRKFVLCAIYLLLAPLSWAQDQPFASYDLESDAILNDAHDLTMGPDGRLYVADKLNGRVVILDADSLEQIGAFGDGLLFNVRDISFGKDGLAYVAVTGTNSVDVFEIDGTDATRVRTYAGIPRTEGATIHSNGRIYATVSGTAEIWALSADAQVLAKASGMSGVHGIEEAPDGTLWAGTSNRRVVQFDQDLNFLRALDPDKFGLIGPRYLDIDELGRLIVADQDAHRFLLIDPDGPDGGTLIGTMGTGHPGKANYQFDDPEGVLVIGNTYYMSDSDNGRIVRYQVITN